MLAMARCVFPSSGRRHDGSFCYYPDVDDFVGGYRLRGCADVVERRVTRFAASREPTFLFEGLLREGPYGMLTASRKRWALEANVRACALLCYRHDQPIGQSFKDVAGPIDARWDVALFYNTVALGRPYITLGYLGPAAGRMLLGSDPDELAGVSASDHILPGDFGGGVREARAAAGCRGSLPLRHLHKGDSWIHLKKVVW
jgi:PAS domain-containing protein